MKEIIVKDKQAYLDEHWGGLKLTDKKNCIHCGKQITVGDYKVFVDEFGEEMIYCPNAPENCDGTPLDWM